MKLRKRRSRKAPEKFRAAVLKEVSGNDGIDASDHEKQRDGVADRTETRNKCVNDLAQGSQAADQS